MVERLPDAIGLDVALGDKQLERKGDYSARPPTEVRIALRVRPSSCTTASLTLCMIFVGRNAGRSSLPQGSIRWESFTNSHSSSPREKGVFTEDEFAQQKARQAEGAAPTVRVLGATGSKRQQSSDRCLFAPRIAPHRPDASVRFRTTGPNPGPSTP
jgi:hypothetical protein